MQYKVTGNQNSFATNSLQNTFFYVPQEKVSHSGLSKLWHNYIFGVNYPFKAPPPLFLNEIML